MSTTPEEFIAHWTASRGNLRRFLEEHALPPVNDRAQRTAGEAAARAAFTAVADSYELEEEDFASGVATVSGAFQAADATQRATGHNTTNPSPTPATSTAAFFDVDNTLIQGASIIVFATGLYRRKYFSLRELIPVAWKQLKFRVTGNENADDVEEGRQQALEFIKGRSVEELVTLCEDIVDTHMSDKIWPGTQALVQQHLDAGDQVWLVSATPVQLAQILARKLGCTGALGTVAEVKDGRFTGRLVGDILHGPGKKHAVAALAAIEGLNLDTCTAYSDSINDVPMLTMVGHAVAVNPDRQLQKMAQLHEWPIEDYRSIRKAIKTFGLPAVLAAAVSLTWRVLRR